LEKGVVCLAAVKRRQKGERRERKELALVRRDELCGIFGSHCKVIFKNAK